MNNFAGNIPQNKFHPSCYILLSNMPWMPMQATPACVAATLL